MYPAPQRLLIGNKTDMDTADPGDIAHGSIPPSLQRPFHAIVFEWDETADTKSHKDAAQLVRVAEPLLGLAIWLVVVARTDFSNIERQFCHLIHQEKRAHLLICANRGSEVYGFTAQGSPLRLWCLAVPEEEDRAFGNVLAWLKRELLAPEGISLNDVLIVGRAFDTPAQPSGSNEHIQPDADEASIASVRTGPEGASPNIVHLGGGPSQFRQLLAHQIALHKTSPTLPDATASDIQHDNNAATSVWTETAFQPTDDPNWLLETHSYIPALEHDIETRFAVSNGLLGVRGALDIPTRASHPRTFIAGLFAPGGQATVNLPALMPVPNWVNIDLSVGGKRLTLDSPDVEWHRRVLDMRRGIVITEWLYRLANNQSGIRLRTLRLASHAARNLTVQITQVAPTPGAKPVNMVLTGAPTLRAAVAKYNSRTKETGSKRNRHGTPASDSTRNQSDVLLVQMQGSKQVIALAGANASWFDGKAARPTEGDSLTPVWKWESQSGQWATFARAVASASDSTLHAASHQATMALWRSSREPPSALLLAHEHAWAERWTASDILIEGDNEAQIALRFAMYHLISAANPTRSDVSIGARGLTGEGYLGHVFWDTDIFALPFFIFTWPDAARALLRYRYHTLPAARAKAARMGYRGALYAWESADTGDEVTPPYIDRPDGAVLPVRCGEQEHHISADIAFAVWRYWQATGDDQFLLDEGAEILLETARFWASRSAVDTAGQRHIYGVIGPDEYHEDIDDNAYTNEMARWNLERGVETAALLSSRWPTRWAELSERLDLSDAELASWTTCARLLAPPHTTPTGVIEQFAGYFGREDITLAAQKPGDLPVDLLLGSDRIAGSQILKQADVLMLLALLGEHYSTRDLEANYRYYAPRCAQGSSLSPAVHACIAARIGDLATAETYLRQAMRIDLSDTLGISAQGVHMGALGGLWNAIVFGFLGLRFDQERLCINPHLLPSWQRLRIPIMWRNRRLIFDVTQEPLTVRLQLEDGAPCSITLGNLPLHLNRQQTVQVRSDDDGRTWSEETP